MSAGRLRNRIAIQEVTETDDGQGGFTETWTKIADGDDWAQIEPLSFREQFFAGQVKPGITHRVIMRHRSDVTEKMRVLFGSRVLDIKGLRNADERSRELELVCEEAR